MLCIEERSFRSKEQKKIKENVSLTLHYSFSLSLFLTLQVPSSNTCIHCQYLNNERSVHVYVNIVIQEAMK